MFIRISQFLTYNLFNFIFVSVPHSQQAVADQVLRCLAFCDQSVLFALGSGTAKIIFGLDRPAGCHIPDHSGGYRGHGGHTSARRMVNFALLRSSVHPHGGSDGTGSD